MLCVLIVEGMSVVVNVMLSLMSVMSPPPALCDILNLLVIIHLIISARQPFNFEIASNGCLHFNETYMSLLDLTVESGIPDSVMRHL